VLTGAVEARHAERGDYREHECQTYEREAERASDGKALHFVRLR
jgi:hypothetical protein